MSKRYLHIGSWNIEHLSKIGDRKENIFALTEHIEMATLDILALQELYVTHKQAGERRNRDLDGVAKLLKEHTGDSWTYEIYQNRRKNDKSQLCGILWNSSVVRKIGKAYRIPVLHSKIEGSFLWDRAPHAVKFKYKNKTDLVLIPIHMKANSGGATKAKKMRHKEALTLIDNMNNIRNEHGDNDIVILGDTNFLRGYEKAAEVFTDNGFDDLNESETGTFVGGRSPFDRIFIPTDQREFAYSRQYIMVSANPDDHDRWLSDHYLIKTVVKIREDDE